MRWRTVALVVAVIAAFCFAVAGPGTRLGLWDFRQGFTLLRWGAYLGMAGVVLALIALAVPASRRAGVLVPLFALALSAAVVLVPFSMLRRARSVAPIHDITTDVVDPPVFVDVLARRAGSPNSAVYGGDSIARQQLAAYPDVRPLDLAIPKAQAFPRALQAARDMGWEIVAADTAAGRIEATATTRWFGFKDDVVVRIRPNGDGGGSHLDVRSVSRVGGSDVGTNAARIRAYLERLKRG
jgi:uncharacterized protein (DUF1499 family)